MNMDLFYDLTQTQKALNESLKTEDMHDHYDPDIFLDKYLGPANASYERIKTINRIINDMENPCHSKCTIYLALDGNKNNIVAIEDEEFYDGFMSLLRRCQKRYAAEFKSHFDRHGNII